MTSVLLSPSETDRELAVSLENSGARVWTWPSVVIHEPNDDSSLSEVIDNLFGYDWLILKNGPHVIGLFQSMFEKNTLTFNPGWDSSAQKVAGFTDVRKLQKQLKADGVKLATEADESTTGPASFMAIDPDGNPILVDQHV